VRAAGHLPPAARSAARAHGRSTRAPVARGSNTFQGRVRHRVDGNEASSSVLRAGVAPSDPTRRIRSVGRASRRRTL
jgi:hypothetical protein